MNQIGVPPGQFCQNLTGAVRRVIIYYNDIKRKISLLLQGRFYSFRNGTIAVSDGNYLRGFPGEFLLSDGYTLKIGSLPGSDRLEVGCTNGFHLQLHFPVGRIDIIELFFTG